MRALKGLVIVMGALIVAGLVTIVVTVANRTLDGGAATEAAFALPAGAEVLETALDGGQDRAPPPPRRRDHGDPRLRPRDGAPRGNRPDRGGRVGGSLDTARTTPSP